MDICYNTLFTNKWLDIIINYDNLYRDKQLTISCILDQVYIKIDKVYPKIDKVFRCFSYFDPDKTRVVIVGQDPYHGYGQACGLCFAVENTEKKPPSLKNIERELIRSLNVKLNDITLEKWARQGVLLLNASLTVYESQPNSHSKYWNEFTLFIIDYLNKLSKSIIFVAWGQYADKLMSNINLDLHYKITTSHPSPLSAKRPYKTNPAFIGSNCFVEINNILTSNNQENIDW